MDKFGLNAKSLPSWAKRGQPGSSGPGSGSAGTNEHGSDSSSTSSSERHQTVVDNGRAGYDPAYGQMARGKWAPRMESQDNVTAKSYLESDAVVHHPKMSSNANLNLNMSQVNHHHHPHHHHQSPSSNSNNSNANSSSGFRNGPDANGRLPAAGVVGTAAIKPGPGNDSTDDDEAAISSDDSAGDGGHGGPSLQMINLEGEEEEDPAIAAQIDGTTYPMMMMSNSSQQQLVSNTTSSGNSNGNVKPPLPPRPPPTAHVSHGSFNVGNPNPNPNLINNSGNNSSENANSSQSTNLFNSPGREGGLGAGNHPGTPSGHGTTTTTTTRTSLNDLRTPTSKKRQDLAKAISEARKKLERLGCKPLESRMTNSKSVINLKVANQNSSPYGPGGGGTGGAAGVWNPSGRYYTPQPDRMKRCVSLSDISIGGSSSSHTASGGALVGPPGSGSQAPLWDMASTSSGSTANYATTGRRSSISSLHRRNTPNQANLANHHLGSSNNSTSSTSNVGNYYGLLHTPTPPHQLPATNHNGMYNTPTSHHGGNNNNNNNHNNNSMRHGMWANANSGRASAPPPPTSGSGRSGSRSNLSGRLGMSNSAHVPGQRMPLGRRGGPGGGGASSTGGLDLSTDDEEEDDNESNFGALNDSSLRTHLRPVTPPKPNIMRHNRSRLSRSTRSEYNLSQIGRSPSTDVGSLNRNPFAHHHHATSQFHENNNRPLMSGLWPSSSQLSASTTLHADKLDLSMTNPANIPLTYELCKYVVDEMAMISNYAMRLHQRAAFGGSSVLRDLLAGGIAKGRRTLSTPLAPTHPAPPIPHPSLGAVSGTGEGGGGPGGGNDQQIEQMFEQYSDKLVEMIERKMASRRTQPSNASEN